MELLHFLRWFKKYGNRPFAILLGHGGDMFSEFEQLGDTWSMVQSRWIPGGVRASLLAASGLGAWARRAERGDVQRFAARCAPALIYVNSIAGALAIEFLDPQIPVLTHVHELESCFHPQRVPSYSTLLARTRQFIACSNAVRSNLIKNHRIDAKSIETVHESIPVDEIKASQSREAMLKELHIPNGAPVVVGGGTVGWGKGTDLFVQLAQEFRRRRSEAYFVWIGTGPELQAAAFEQDIRATGLTEKIRCTGSVSNPADYLAAADVFVLTSREDSYPLICLEAATLAKPIVCFESAGGMPEFVEQDCGFVTPYIDIIAMANRLLQLLDSPDLRTTMGACARRKVAQRHDVKDAAKTIAGIIERTIQENGATAG